MAAQRTRRLRTRRAVARSARGQFEALVGVNLLREGLDLPEVSLVAILDADKEGFLRSETSLMQTIGRAARNVNAKVILYADQMTESMQTGDRRDRAPPRLASGLQPRARHHARNDSQGNPVRHRVRSRRPCQGQRRGRPDRRNPVHHRRISRRARSRDAGRGRSAWNSSGRPRFATGSKKCDRRSARRSTKSTQKPTISGAGAAGAKGRRRVPAPQTLVTLPRGWPRHWPDGKAKTCDEPKAGEGVLPRA